MADNKVVSVKPKVRPKGRPFKRKDTLVRVDPGLAELCKTTADAFDTATQAFITDALNRAWEASLVQLRASFRQEIDKYVHATVGSGQPVMSDRKSKPAFAFKLGLATALDDQVQNLSQFHESTIAQHFDAACLILRNSLDERAAKLADTSATSAN